ncbi:MAG: DUF3592 domain-containing protein [Thermoanaerobaculia bacterium]
MKRALLFGGVPVIAGIVIIVVWAIADTAASRGNGWTQVIARIETSTVQPGAVDIAYRYEVDGTEHRNPNGRVILRNPASAARVAERYAAGRQVLAYVNPAKPSESFLEPPARPSSTNLMAGTVLVIVGVPIGIYFLRAKTGRKRKPVRRPSRPMSRLKPPPAIPRKPSPPPTPPPAPPPA